MAFTLGGIRGLRVWLRVARDISESCEAVMWENVVLLPYFAFLSLPLVREQHTPVYMAYCTALLQPCQPRSLHKDSST